MTYPTSLSDLALSRDGGQPLHRQLKSQITLRIRSGALPPGARLPAVRDLARVLGLNRNTVQKAYAGLARAGLLATRVGSGTVVAAGRIEPASPMATATRDRLRQAITDALDAGLTSHDLRLVLEAELAQAVQRRDSRATEILMSRRRFSGRSAYGAGSLPDRD